MKLKFFKYQGAGNDFVMIDDRQQTFPISTKLINRLCDRHFGVGADGLILLQNDKEFDFKMVYFNSDGNESTMCGNGGRCIIRFANDLDIASENMTFTAIDGLHHGIVDNNVIRLQMIDVDEVEDHDHYLFMNTGSPHHVEFVEKVDDVDVYNRGKEIRNGSPYFEKGSNVNFVEVMPDNNLRIRTYERGVENETLACGTGITAAAISAYVKNLVDKKSIEIKALGGDLSVNFEENNHKFVNVWLNGPAVKVFEGEIEI
ncbi:diaminopimelate epimerase [Algoriella xinjiangensis]|uniref:Diaminopimelate epimerase n=1 Tax=Algoriella xinjiangensis TaxID=684065 RepID=A0A1I4VDM1_9FLAO|nr:diaminopimelate epimerase [Algoriella xinjiangensis]SFM99233.1 diaminopimelate epimerase [Algoriella xinjiangensis]VDH17115.1 Diaminopimelate epimerase [Algoriella xinjiangensis]